MCCGRVKSCAYLQNDLAGLAVLDDANGVRHAIERKAMGDDGPRIELTRADEPEHDVPGVVHSPSGHSIQREALEDDVAREVHLGRATRRAQQVPAAAEA